MHRDLHHIPLADLKLSKLNVRRHGPKDIDSLAASVAALGLADAGRLVDLAKTQSKGVLQPKHLAHFAHR